MKEHGDKLSAEDKAKVEGDVTALKEALKSDNSDDIKDKVKSLTESAMKLGEAVYKQQQESQPQQEEKAKDDNVVDADFEEVNKNDSKQ
jgi:molecular chaperone DnaK